MNALTWIAKRDPGFGGLGEDAQTKMTEFLWLWTYFEANIFLGAASPKAIVKLADDLAKANAIDLEKLKGPVSYFRARYFAGDDFTYHYGHLHLRKSDNVELVRAVLSGADDSARSQLACALTVTYRYRNNFFHGLKWAYGLQGQQQNFEVANRLLTMTIEMSGAAHET